MAWFFRIFFGGIALCLLIWLGGFVKNCLSPKRTEPAVVKERKTNLFPMSFGTARKDRTEYELVFFLPGSRKTLGFTVSKTLYDRCPEGTGGVLVCRGSRLIRFETEPNPVQ